jgi:hypothetical protein
VIVRLLSSKQLRHERAGGGQAPGALQHIIIRGIERKRISFDDGDRNDFLDRLGDIQKNQLMNLWTSPLFKGSQGCQKGEMMEQSNKNSRIVNSPKRNDPEIQFIRGALEHRATWMYLLLKEAEKKGIRWEDIGRPAIRACGNMHGESFVQRSGTTTLIGLKDKLFTESAQRIFEIEILESTDDKLSVDFGYCPLVAAWQKLGCSDEDIARLCDIAMEGDRGIVERFGGRLELGGTIANGHNTCQVEFLK